MPSATVSRVLGALRKVKRSGDGWAALCPAHEDSLSSLAVSEGRDGRTVLYCFAGCTTESVVAAIGLAMGDLFPPKDGTMLPPRDPPRVQSITKQPDPPKTDESAKWPTVATYDYTDANGQVVFQVLRKEPALQPAEGKRQKTFYQRRPDGSGGYIAGLGNLKQRPLFRLPELIEDLAIERVVLLVEGEKDVNTARSIGLSATTHMGGAAAWRPEYAEQLRGGHVVIIPDNDTPGREWAALAAGSLYGVAASLRILPLPNVGIGGDLTDWTEGGYARAQLDRLIQRAVPWLPGHPIPEARPTRFVVLSDEDLEAQPPMTWLAAGILPAAALLALYGEPGCGKSFVAMDLALSVASDRVWFTYAVTPGAVLYVAAEGSAGMRQRVSAWKTYTGIQQIARVGFITESANLLDHKDVDHIMRALDQLTDEPRLIVFDTLARSMPGGDENNTEDMSQLIEHADQLRQRTAASVLLVHHTRKDSEIERGSTALRGGVDTLALIGEGEGGRTIFCEKQKDAPAFEPITFHLTAVTPSCVVTMTKGPDGEGLTSRQRAVLNILNSHFTTTGATATDWQKACEGKITARTFYRARTDLVKEGYVVEGHQGKGTRYMISPLGLTATTATLLPRPAEGNGSTGEVSGISPLRGVTTTPTPSLSRLQLFEDSGSDGSNRGSGSEGGSSRRMDLE